MIFVCLCVFHIPQKASYFQSQKCRRKKNIFTRLYIFNPNIFLDSFGFRMSVDAAFLCKLLYIYKLWIDTLNEWESVSSIKQCIETLAVAFLLVYIFMFLILQLCVFLCLTDGGKESEKERKRERKQQTLTEHNKMTCSRSHFALFVCSVAVWQYLMEID